MSRVQTVCLVLAVVFACTESYKTGAPVGACELMTPYHLDKKNSSIVTEAQNVENPYDLLVSTNTVVSLPYAGNNSSPTNSAPYVKVMIKSKNGTTPYEGFILQARSVSNSAIVGSFRVDNTNTSQTMNCPGGVKNAVTHLSDEKKLSDIFYWTPDAGYSGQVVFSATVVRGYSRFWVGLKSRPVNVTVSA